MPSERHHHSFTFEPGEEVLVLDAIAGVIIGQQHVCGDEDRYLVEYVTGDGVPVEQWWRETALTADPDGDDGETAKASGGAIEEFPDNVVPMRRAN